MSANTSTAHTKQPGAPTARNSASDCAAALTAIFKVTTIDSATMPLFLALMDVAAGRATPFKMADRFVGQRLARRSGVAVEFEDGDAGDRAHAKRFRNAWQLADAEQHRTGHRLAERRRGGLRGEDREKMRRVASSYTVPLVEIVPDVIRRARGLRGFYGKQRAEMYERAATEVLRTRAQDYESETIGKESPKGTRTAKAQATNKASAEESDAKSTRVIKAHARVVAAAVENIKRLSLPESDADALRAALHDQIEESFASLFADATPGEVAPGVYYSVSGKVVHPEDSPAEPEFAPLELSEFDSFAPLETPPEPSPECTQDVHANYTPIFTKANVYAGENEIKSPWACSIAPSESTPEIPLETPPKPTPSETLNLLTQALTYASFGWHVFPVHSWTGSDCTCGKADCENAAKHPIHSLAPNGFKNATTDEATIRAWWGKAPFANIGIATGKVSDLFVLDVDPKHDGWEGLRALMERIDEPFPPTVEAITGSGGRHFLFRMPDADIRNSAGKVGAGLDVRANGGYIVAAPSLHRSGNRYQWASDEAMLADVPYKLMRELTETKRPAKREVTPTGFTPKSAWTCGSIADGSRNDTLFRRAAAMRGAGASEDEIFNALHDLNSSCSPPLAARELSKIAASAATYATNGRRII